MDAAARLGRPPDCAARGDMAESMDRRPQMEEEVLLSEGRPPKVGLPSRAESSEPRCRLAKELKGLGGSSVGPWVSSAKSAAGQKERTGSGRQVKRRRKRHAPGL